MDDNNDSDRDRDPNQTERGLSTPAPLVAQPLWTRTKSPRAEPLLLARMISPHWLDETSIEVLSASFSGDLREALLDLKESAKAAKKSLPALPIRSLRLMLQTALDGVVSVDRDLGLGLRGSAAMEFMDRQVSEFDLKELVAATVKRWAINVLETWAQANGFGKFATRVRKTATAQHIEVGARPTRLREDRRGGLNFNLVRRLIADQLASQVLFDGMGPCEIVISGDPGGHIELMSLPRKPLNEAGGKNLFSMVARIHVSTAPYTEAVFLSLSAAKRVWANKLPDGKSTGRSATAYVFSPDGERLPVGMKLGRVADCWAWVFEDEYAALVAASGNNLPDSVEGALARGPYVEGEWWVGIPQVTRLYRRVDQHSVMESDEAALLETCLPMLAGMVSDGSTFWASRRLNLNKQPQQAMLKLKDVGAAGAALYEDDADTDLVEIDDDEGDAVGGGEFGVSEDTKVGNFRSQCVNVLKAANRDARGTLFVIGGTPAEQEIVRKTAEVLFGDWVTVKTDPLPADVHGMRKEMPGEKQIARLRFGLRVDAWKKSGLPQAVAVHNGPRYVMIIADKERGYKAEDSVNRRAAIHAICDLANANVHHLLPTEPVKIPSPQREAKVAQAFVHRCQSAMMDVMLAHSGYVIGAGTFVAAQMGNSKSRYVYGIQALRKNAQRYTGETPVCMALYTRLDLASNVTEISYGYSDSTGTHRSDWMPLSAGLVWLGRQRSIASDEDWLRGNFSSMTLGVLGEAQSQDPHAIVFVDWSTVAGLWPELRDDDLRPGAIARIAQVSIAERFPQMSFVRLRSGRDAAIALRSRSRVTYERVGRPGELYTDDYAGTLKQLVELRGSESGRGHFIGVMGPRKTFQLKRGKSCYRFMPRMSGKGVYTRELLPPLDKDGSVPTSTDLTVFHVPTGGDPAAVASVAMGLRLGYAHYNDWTVLPAPLFFMRKIDDYIIKYPDPGQEEDHESDGERVDVVEAAGSDARSDAGGAVDADAQSFIGTDAGDGTVDDDLAATSAVVVLAAQQILAKVSDAHAAQGMQRPKPSPHSGTSEAANAGADPAPANKGVAAPTPDAPGMNEPEGMPIQAPHLAEFDGLLRSLVEAVNAESQSAPYLNSSLCTELLALSKSVNFDAQPDFTGSVKLERMFSAMVRNDITVTVEVPYFVKFKGLLGSYRPELKSSIRKAWKSFGQRGYVRPGAGRPSFNDFYDWVAQKMRHPQGALMSNALSSSPGEFVIPQVEAIVVGLCKREEIEVPSIDVADDDARALSIDMAKVTRLLLDENNDEAVAWLVFSSAQIPRYGFATTVVQTLDRIPGPRTLAALLYCLQCHSAIGHLLQEYGKAAGRLTIQYPRAYSPGEAVASAAPAVVDDPTSPLTPLLEVSGSKTTAPLATSIHGDKFMKARDGAIRLLESIQPDLVDVCAVLAQVRALISEMETLDVQQQKAATDRFVWDKLRHRASALLAEILAMDEEEDLVRYRLTSHLTGELTLLESQLLNLELTIDTARSTYQAFQSAVGMPQATRAELRLRATAITSTSGPFDDALKVVGDAMAGCDFLEPEGGGDEPKPGEPKPVATVSTPASSAATALAAPAGAALTDIATPVAAAEPQEALAPAIPATMHPEVMDRLGFAHQAPAAPFSAGPIATVHPHHKAEFPQMPQTVSPHPIEIEGSENKPPPAGAEARPPPRTLIEAAANPVQGTQPNKVAATATAAAASLTAASVASGPTSATGRSQGEKQIEQAQIDPANDHLKELVRAARRVDQAYRHLKELIAKRYYGLADIYNVATGLAFEDAPTQAHSVVLGSLINSLEAIDCGFEIDAKLDPQFKEMLQAGLGATGVNCTPLGREIGIFGAGFVSMLFASASSVEEDDVFWTVLGPVRQPLMLLPAVSGLVDHMVSMKTKGIIPTREKLVASQIGDEVALNKQVERERQRAAHWSEDRSLSGFNHRGFDKMHEFIFSSRHPIGRCLAAIANGDTAAARAAYAACQNKFRKPGATVIEAFRSVGEITKPDGALASNSVQNLATTEDFIKHFLLLQEAGPSSSDAISTHDRGQLKALHQKLQSARDELAARASNLPLDQIYIEGTRRVIDSVLGLFADQPPMACVPLDKQKLLVQVPMDRTLMPSVFGDEALCNGSDVMDSIEDLIGEEAAGLDDPDAEIDDLLVEAQRMHLAEGRLLPALRIEAALVGKATQKSGQSLAARFQKQRSSLSQRIQNARQRVTHAMALSALDQKEANRLLITIESIQLFNRPDKGSIGSPDCTSESYPDFPHATAALNRVLMVLDARLQNAKDALRQELSEYEASNPDSVRDIARIRRMLERETPASIRTAHDALARLRAGKKLPPNLFEGYAIPPKEFTAFAEQIRVVRGHSHIVDALAEELSSAPHNNTPDLVRSMTEETRHEAIQFINAWKDMCATSAVESAAEKASQFFARLGIGEPTYMPEATRRMARFQFPQNAFSVFANTDCFIPPSLGSESQVVCGYVVPGSQPDNVLNTIIQDASVPTFILSRARLSLEKRAQLSGAQPVLLIDDHLIAYIALHADDRARRMMEIATLTFHAQPYGADGTAVSREMFFGRQRELNSLREVKNLAVLYGGRRLGKSSLLAQIEREQEQVAGNLVIYISMDDYAGGDHLLFAWRKLYYALLNKRVISAIAQDGSDWKRIRDWVEQQVVRPGQEINSCYMLLDETDNLMAEDLDLGEGKTGFVRSLQQMAENVQTRFKLRYVIAGLHNLARFTSESNTALGKAEIIALEPFTSEDDLKRGVQLITKPLAALGFFFSQDAEDLPMQILSICNNFPAFIQIYCGKLLEVLYNKRGQQAYTFVTAADLERVESNDDLLHDLQQKFKLTLDLDHRYRAIALILAETYYTEVEAGKGDEGLSVGDIRDFCEIEAQPHFAGLTGAAYEGLLDEMRKLNVLEKNGSKYRLRNPSIAMLIGDRDSIRFQLADLSKMTPKRARDHGDRRKRLGSFDKTHSASAPIFPMPVAWTHAQMETVDGNLLILGGNNLSGIQEVLTARGEWQLGQNDVYCAAQLTSPQVGPHIAKLRKQVTFTKGSQLQTQTHLTRDKKLFLACSPNSWRAAEIPQFGAVALKAKASQARLALIAHPDRLYEIAKSLHRGWIHEGSEKTIDWSVECVPPWSADALRFFLNDNVSVAENQGAVDAILKASCGFGREIQNICAGESLTVARAMDLPAKARVKLCPDLATFYGWIGWPKDIEESKRAKMEEFMAHAHGEPRGAAVVEGLLVDFGLNVYDLKFLQWMGLMQQAQGNTWFVPELYRGLLR